MFKKSYYLNPDTIRFERVTHPISKKIRIITFVFFILIAFAAFLRIEFDKVAESPKKLLLVEKNNRLKFAFSHLSSEIEKAEQLLSDIQKRDDHIYRAILDIASIPGSIREAGVGGSENITYMLQNKSSEFVVTNATQLEKLFNRTKIQAVSLEDISVIAGKKLKMIAGKPAIQPLAPSDDLWLSSAFGMRQDPFTSLRRMHQGIDLAGRIGMDVYATGDGKVIESSVSRFGYGKEVLIDHGYGYTSRYAHLHKILVKPGDSVKRGQLIGLLGNTGRSTGPHLHYEVRYHNKPQNPMYFFHDNLSLEEFSKITLQANR